MKYLLFIFMVLSVIGCKSIPKDEAKENGSEKVNIEKIQSKKQLQERTDMLQKKVTDAKQSTFDVKYEVLASGSYANNFDSAIIRNQKQFEQMYVAIYKTTNQMPVIDFSKKAVVVAKAGQFSTGGYSIGLQSAVKTQDALDLVFFVSSPGPTDIVTQAFTNPFIVVSVDAEPKTKINIIIAGAQSREEFGSMY